MSDLSPEARALLDAARAHDHPSPVDRRRMRAAIAAQIAVAAGAGVVASSSSAQAATAAPTALSAGLKAESAAKLSWSLASLSSTKGVAVAAAVAALSTTASVTNYVRMRSSRASAQAIVTEAHRGAHARSTPAAKDPPVAPPLAVVTTTVNAPSTVSVTVTPTPREAARVTSEPAASRTSTTTVVRVPSVAAGEAPAVAPAQPTMAPWECAREIDRALMRGDNAAALAWVDRCRAQLDGPEGSMLGAREVTALCAEGRSADAVAAARRVLSLDSSVQSRRRIERTCASGLLRGEE